MKKKKKKQTKKKQTKNPQKNKIVYLNIGGKHKSAPVIISRGLDMKAYLTIILG